MREIPITACGKTYTLYAGNRALRLVERELGMTFLEALERLDRVDLNVITTMLWAMLQKHHPDISLEDVDDIIDCNGTEWMMHVLQDALGRALNLDDAVVEDARAMVLKNGATATAGKAKRGTGTHS